VFGVLNATAVRTAWAVDLNRKGVLQTTLLDSGCVRLFLHVPPFDLALLTAYVLTTDASTPATALSTHADVKRETFPDH
jgi:hypothetical protein